MAIENFTPLPAVIGGVLIGLASVWLLVANGRIAGVSGILHGLFAGPAASAPGARAGDRLWRAWFIAGLVVAGFALARLRRPRAHPPGLRPRLGRARRVPRRLRHAHERRLHQRSRRVRVWPAVAAPARRPRGLYGRRHGSRPPRASPARAARLVASPSAFRARLPVGIGLW